MKVVLLEDVRKVGKKGDVVTVSDGYGQNFLIKNKLAVKETPASKKILEQQKEEARLQDIENKKNAEAITINPNKIKKDSDEDTKALKEKIEGITLEFVLKSGKDGKTFGSVSTKHIVEQLREKYDIRVDKRKFINAHPIGALGYSNLKVELYKGVIATIRVHLSEK